MFTPGKIEAYLREDSPWRVFLVGHVASTMDDARRLADEYPHGDFLVAVAESQSAGLGRHARHWDSSTDGLAMTAVLRPSLSAAQAPWFTLGAAVAVADALKGMGFDVGIKWPNDVLSTSTDFYRRKLCGIRCEMKLSTTGLSWISLGIGVNVNHCEFPEEIARKAASLRQLDGGREVSRSQVAAAILDTLEGVYATLEHEGFAPVRQRWLNLAVGLGELATVNDGDGPGPLDTTTGIVHGLDEEGHLLLEIEGKQGLHTVVAGDLVFEV